MKKNLPRALLILALCVGLCATLLSFGAADSGPDTVYTVDKPYEYPIVPGTDAWLKLDSLNDMIEACHVDEELMASMTTPALVETVINYPLLINVFAYDHVEKGIEAVSEYFKGIELLAAREDAARYLREYAQAQAQTHGEMPSDIWVSTAIMTRCLDVDLSDLDPSWSSLRPSRIR